MGLEMVLATLVGFALGCVFTLLIVFSTLLDIDDDESDDA